MYILLQLDPISPVFCETDVDRNQQKTDKYSSLLVQYCPIIEPLHRKLSFVVIMVRARVRVVDVANNHELVKINRKDESCHPNISHSRTKVSGNILPPMNNL